MPVLGWFFKLAKAIPGGASRLRTLPPTRPPWTPPTQVLAEGDLLAIFPEGGITQQRRRCSPSRAG